MELCFITMHRDEINGHCLSALLPISSLAYLAVGDVTERAMTTTESSANEIGKLTSECSIGVVDANELHNLLRSLGE